SIRQFQLPATDTKGALLGALPIVTTTGWSPGLSCGTSMFACTRPTNPGVMPRKEMLAAWPPIFAVAFADTLDNGDNGVMAPVAIALSSRKSRQISRMGMFRP